MSRTRLDKMVDEFADKMKKRLRQKSRDGWTGWSEDWFNHTVISGRIREQSYRDYIDPIDLANYCAFLDLKRKESSWVTCWKCNGEGFSHHDCGEDCCCCADPVDNVPCDICNGEGGYEKPFGDFIQGVPKSSAEVENEQS